MVFLKFFISYLLWISKQLYYFWSILSFRLNIIFSMPENFPFKLAIKIFLKTFLSCLQLVRLQFIFADSVCSFNFYLFASCSFQLSCIVEVQEVRKSKCTYAAAQRTLPNNLLFILYIHIYFWVLHIIKSTNTLKRSWHL